MSGIEYLRIYSDTEGCSHFEMKNIEMAPKDYAPPAPPLNTSMLESANNNVFLELPVGWYGDWHPSPFRQWLIILSGECEFESGDGEKVVCKAGDMALLEDTTGKGHQTEVLGNIAVKIAAIHLT
jgi:quercetin dioxygenase-like cupin family protein